MARNLDLTPSSNRDNYIRLTRLLIAGGTPILRALFDSYHPPEQLATNLNHWRTHLERVAKLTSPQKELLFPASGDPVSTNFDLSLVYKLLRNICGLMEPNCGWSGFPQEGEQFFQDDIVRIRFYRNEIYGHVLEDMALSADEFYKYWKGISEALRRIASQNGNSREVEEQIFQLRYSQLTKDDTFKYLKEIQESLEHQDEALDRIETQGGEIQKGIEGLQDTMLQTAVAQQLQISKPTTSMKIASEARTHNTTITHINYNFGNVFYHPPSSSKAPDIRDIDPLSGSLAVEDVRGNDGSSSIRKSLDNRAISCPSGSNADHGSEVNHERRRSTNSPHYCTEIPMISEFDATFEQNSGGASIPKGVWSSSKDFATSEKTLALTWQQNKNHTCDQESSGSYYPGGRVSSNVNEISTVNTSQGVPWSHSNNQSPFQGHRRGSYAGSATSLPLEPMLLPVQNDVWVPPVQSDQRYQDGLPSSRSFPDVTSPRASSTPEPKFAQTNQSHGTNQSGHTNLCNKMTEKGTSSSDQMQASSKQVFEKYYRDNGGGARQSVDASSQVDQRFQSQSGNDDRILHIHVCVHGNPSSRNFHLGQLMSQSLDWRVSSSTDNQFRSYLEVARQLVIEEVDDHQPMYCSIGVSSRDMTSLEALWRDCMTNDLREIIKETVLPQDFDTEIEVRIDGKEYEACCDALRPRDLKETGKISFSHSFTHTEGMSDEEESNPRSRSLVELSTSSQRASDELFLLICKNGGKMKYASALEKLTPNGRAEVTKAMTLGKMESRFRILPENLIQARLNFCQKHASSNNSNTSGCTDPNCLDLHLCPYNLLEGCTFKGNCKNSHNISDAHTDRVFRQANLSTLSLEERLKLLENVAYTIPEICTFYNAIQNKCSKGEACRFLHVCKSWVIDKCPFKDRCTRAHTFIHPPTQNILMQRNLQQLSEREIKEKFKL